MKSEVKTFKSAEDLYESAAKFVLKAALQAVEESGRFSIALSGGRTPVALYEKLTTRPIKEDMPWKKTNFFLGDERCVPPDHEESNFKMIEETLLSKISIPEGNIHRILAEIKPPEKAALLYEEDVRSFFGVDENNKAPSFDLIVLGLGIDGHTASLFPGDDVLDENRRLVVANRAPKSLGSKWRVTLTLPLINLARNVIFLAIGPEKKKIVDAIFENPDKSQLIYPAALVHPEEEIVWFVGDYVI